MPAWPVLNPLPWREGSAKRTPPAFAMRFFPSQFVTLAVGALALLMAVTVASAQSRVKPRAQARALPAAKASPFSLVSPAVNAGESNQGQYPANGEVNVPALVLHGQGPGPVIAYVFHGFTSHEAFYGEMDAIFGPLDPTRMQGTVLALSLPERTSCEGNCADAKLQTWHRLAPSILNDARFVVEVHQKRGGDRLPTYAFVYKAAENARLANYVESMARAALVPNVVELSELDAPADHLQHLSPLSIALEHPAINIETATLEGDNSSGAAQLRKGLVNVLHHLKMAPGAVSWQSSVKKHSLTDVRALILPQ